MSKKETETGYQVVGVTTPTQVVPDVEMLTRDDTDNGRWTVHSCSAQAGEPKTAVAERLMFVPTYDDEHSRHVRAHEMFHAKVSPTTKQYEKIWAKRGYANDRTLVACEELRVNTLMKMAGFEPHLHLEGGSEELSGRLMASHNDFQSAVLATIATGNTAGQAKLWEGIGKVRPEWIPMLAKFSEEAISFFTSVEEQNKEHEKEGRHWRIMPSLNATGAKATENGFGYTESLAKWVEEVVGAITDPKTKPKHEQKPEGKKGKKGDEGKDGKDGEGMSDAEMKKLLKAIGEAGKTKREERQAWGSGAIPRKGKKEMWETLKVARPPLVRSVVGAIGKKRIASPTGRNPRRMSRLLTDPERRIFDRTVRGAGGVLLIDTSGSMSLSADEVKEMVANAPSALVAQYSGGSRIHPNLYVVANKGRMVEKLPRPNGSNGMDFPALEWAIKQRQRQSSPVIWVSDGGVTGKGDAFHEDLVMECIRICKKEGVYVVPSPKEAIDLLKRLQRREKITSVVPHQLATTYKEVTGHELVLR